ncbi:Putative AC transposase, partial [Linum perenne]
DFLTIPITSVTSESTFSTCGSLLDPHRCKLHHSTVEAMMCARSWVKEEISRVEADTKLADLESVFSALAVEDEAGADEDGKAYVSGACF